MPGDWYPYRDDVWFGSLASALFELALSEMPVNEMVRRLILLPGQEDRSGSF